MNAKLRSFAQPRTMNNDGITKECEPLRKHEITYGFHGDPTNGQPSQITRNHQELNLAQRSIPTSLW